MERYAPQSFLLSRTTSLLYDGVFKEHKLGSEMMTQTAVATEGLENPGRVISVDGQDHFCPCLNSRCNFFAITGLLSAGNLTGL